MPKILKDNRKDLTPVASADGGQTGDRINVRPKIANASPQNVSQPVVFSATKAPAEQTEDVS
jgi:hypothetical protein